MDRKGFVPVVVLLIVVVALAAGGIWYYNAHKSAPFQISNPNTETSSTNGYRLSNNADNLFGQVAFDFDAPQICNKIPTNVYGAASFETSQYMIWYDQSDCYQEIAIKYGNSALCSKVIQNTSNPLLDGSGYSEQACSKDVVASSQNPDVRAEETSGFSVDDASLVSAMQQMGYTEDIVSSSPAGEASRSNNSQSFLNANVRNPDFVAKVQDGVDYAESFTGGSRPVNPVEYLYGLVAYDNNLPSLCDKISPGAFYLNNDQEALGRQSLRDACFGSVAIEMANPAGCNQIPNTQTKPMANDFGAEVHDYSVQECKDIITESLSFCDNNTSYPTPSSVASCRTAQTVHPGYVDFPTAEVRVVALTNFGYNPAGVSIQDAYSRFYQNILQSNDTDTKAQFISRVENLTDSF